MQKSRGNLTEIAIILKAACLCISLLALPLASNAATQIIGWGANYSGQLNIPAGLSNLIDISAYGDNSSSLRETGIPVQWGPITNDPAHKVPATLGNAVAISAGADPFN